MYDMINEGWADIWILLLAPVCRCLCKAVYDLALTVSMVCISRSKSTRCTHEPICVLLSAGTSEVDDFITVSTRVSNNRLHMSASVGMCGKNKKKTLLGGGGDE